MKKRPKTGERRSVRQPLKIDKLSPEAHNEIVRLREKDGKTWLEIEELSPNFAGERLPHSSLQRWFDLRVEQLRKEALARAEWARETAAIFADKDFKKLPESVKNALGGQIFAMMQASGERNEKEFRRQLINLGRLLVDFRRIEILQQRATTEDKRMALLQEEADRKRKQFDKFTHDAAAKIGKGKAVTAEDINRIRERVFGLGPAAGSHPA